MKRAVQKLTELLHICLFISASNMCNLEMAVGTKGLRIVWNDFIAIAFQLCLRICH